jgi:glutathione S-transferase
VILYWARGACSFGPHVVLEEIGAKFEARRVDPTQPRSDDYLKLHPRGHVPLFVDGDFVLTEAHAIMVHLADTFPRAGLIPAPGSRDRARAHELSGILSSAVHVAYRQIRRPARFTEEEAAHPGIKKHGHAYMTRLMTELDQRIAGKQWALGELYSFVDPYLMIMTKWAHTAELDMTRLENLAAHTKRMLERPAVKRAVEREEMNPWL